MCGGGLQFAAHSTVTLLPSVTGFFASFSVTVTGLSGCRKSLFTTRIERQFLGNVCIQIGKRFHLHNMLSVFSRLFLVNLLNCAEHVMLL